MRYPGPMPEAMPKIDTFLRLIWAFLRDFARFSGRRGVMTVLLVTAGSLLESVGLVLMIPLLGVITSTGTQHGALQHITARLFDLFGATTITGRLGVLLGFFVLVMLVRAFVLLRRDVAAITLQLGFVESQRAQIIQMLAAASWKSVSRLRHARIAQIMSGDI